MNPVFIKTMTPIEKYSISDIPYYVKREDLACEAPAPPFAKVRGLYPHLQKMKELNVRRIGYMDTAISMGGWGLAYFCQRLKIPLTLYYPHYKQGFVYNQREYMKKWKLCGADMRAVEPPNLYAINILRAKKMFAAEFPEGVWMQDGLRFDETIDAVAFESATAMNELQPATIVCNIGSGVMISGIMRGILKSHKRVQRLVGVLAHRELNLQNKMKIVLQTAGFRELDFGLFGNKVKSITDDFTIVPGGYLYTEKARVLAPFPCNAYYDLKAFEWMIANIHQLPQPVLFWNIGA